MVTSCVENDFQNMLLKERGKDRSEWKTRTKMDKAIG
jgi:hypothetical protein